MKNITRFGALVFIGMAVLIPFSSAYAASLSIQSLAPGASVLAKNTLSFSIVPSGYQAQIYTLTDSFARSTASVNNIDPVGKFTWTPIASDVGTHTFTVTASNSSGETAQTTQTVTVLPPPSIVLQAIAPGPKVLPGTKFSFTVVPTGFTNPQYIVADEFGGSTVNAVKIDASGNFVWTPDLTQNGAHTITVYASDSLGHSAEAKTSVQVGAGPSLSLMSILPGTTVALGQTLTFTAVPMNYSPTGFTVHDTYAGVTSVTGVNIGSSGLFSWTPQGTETGTHTLTVIGTVGAFGDTASVQQTIFVGKPGETAPLAASTTPTAALSTVSASTSPLSALQAQLAFLQARLAAQGVGAGTPAASNPIPSGPPSARYAFKKLLIFGNRGTDVMELQKRLIELGYLSGEATGYFGNATREAVKKFQKAHAIDVRGHVGPATRAALNEQ